MRTSKPQVLVLLRRLVVDADVRAQRIDGPEDTCSRSTAQANAQRLLPRLCCSPTGTGGVRPEGLGRQNGGNGVSFRN